MLLSCESELFSVVCLFSGLLSSSFAAAAAFLSSICLFSVFWCVCACVLVGGEGSGLRTTELLQIRLHDTAEPDNY